MTHLLGELPFFLRPFQGFHKCAQISDFDYVS